MVGPALLVGAAILGGYWLLDLIGFRGRVPVETMARSRSRLAWVVAPLGLGCLLVAAVVLPWELLGTGPSEDSGPLVFGCVGLASWLVAMRWPARWFPDEEWHRGMRRTYLAVGVLAMILIALGPFIAD